MEKHIRVVNLNKLEDVNYLLRELKQRCNAVHINKELILENIGWDAYINEDGYKFRITYYNGKQLIQYLFDMDGNRLSEEYPAQAAAQMSKAHKVERVRDILNIDPESILGVKPLLEKNKLFDGVGVLAYEYDLSSAYLQMLKEPLPITSSIQYNVELKENQIGFYECDGYTKAVFEPGVYCDYVFDLQESPYKEWCDKLQAKIIEEVDEGKKEDLKNRYRYAVGCLKHTNPFWRNTIIARCNKAVTDLVKPSEYVYCNTDSIVSIKKLDDEVLAKYNWKLKRKLEEFKWAKGKMNYQWNLESPKMKGPFKRYVDYYNKHSEKPFDILTDKIPTELHHRYELNRETLQIEDRGE